MKVKQKVSVMSLKHDQVTEGAAVKLNRDIMYYMRLENISVRRCKTPPGGRGGLLQDYTGSNWTLHNLCKKNGVMTHGRNSCAQYVHNDDGKTIKDSTVGLLYLTVAQMGFWFVNCTVIHF